MSSLAFWILFFFGIILITVLYLLKTYGRVYKYSAMLPTYPIKMNALGHLVYMSSKRGSISDHVYALQLLHGLCYGGFGEAQIFNIWISVVPVVGIATPQNMEAILSSSSHIEKSKFYELLHPWLGTGLLTSTGDKWKRRRKILTPTFHFKILEDFLTIFNEQSFVMVEKLSSYTDKKYVDIVPLSTMCTLDIISETAMGVRIGAQNDCNSEYVLAIKEAGEQFMSRLIKPWTWNKFIYSLFPSGRQYYKTLDILHNFTRKIIKERKEAFNKGADVNCEEIKDANANDACFGRKKRRAFLDLLLDYQKTDSSLTEEDIREEVDTFMFEGHDTTAAGITFALYCIGLYPKIQKKIHEELDEIFGDDINRPVTANDISQMKYLECVLKESQRLFPSVPMIGRQLNEDIVLDGFTIPKGVTLLIFIYMLHRYPDSFNNPEIFDPDRFSPENSAGRHPYSYVPFSAGPRNCIGQKFALMEEKTVVANILRNYTLRSLDPRDKLLLKMELVLRNDDEIRIEVRKRIR